MRYLKQKNLGDKVVYFSKWGRKSYSLFATLRKVVNISVLSVTYLLSVPVAAGAQPQDTSEVQMQYDLDEVEVTASRAPVLYSQVARVLTVIGAQEIERVPAENIQDLLEYVAGVDIRQRGAEGVQADISIRGGTFDQLLILLNGINITDPQTGHHNLNLPVSLSQIERIEILEGPAARIYGPNAFSGAINIVTRTPDSQSLSAQFSTGSFSYFNTGLSGSFRTGKLNHLLAANRKSSAGYLPNTDFSFSNVYYSGEWLSGAGKLFFQGGMAGKGFGANSFYTPVYPNQFEEVRTFLGSVRFESKTKLHFTPAVYWRRHADKFMLFRDDAPSWYTNHNYHRTDVVGVDVNSWVLWRGGKTSFGAGYRSEAIRSNVLGEPMAEIINPPGSEAFYSHSKNRQIVSAFAEHALFFGKWSFSSGVMANYISDRQGGVNFFPGLDLSYNIIRPVKLIASWNTSLRMPTFTDLYYNGPTNVGNPELQPERSSALEGGLKLSSKHVKGHAVFYHRKGNNLIDWVKAEGDSLWKSMNHTEINSRGLELHLVYFPAAHLGNKWPQRVEFGYLFNSQSKEESPLVSYYVMDNLRHKLVASANQYLTKNIWLEVTAMFQDREGTFTFYDGAGYNGEVAYEPLWTIDAKATYQRRMLKVFVSANNLFNRQYYDIGNVMQPGRWIKAGVSFHLPFAE